MVTQYRHKIENKMKPKSNFPGLRTLNGAFYVVIDLSSFTVKRQLLPLLLLMLSSVAN
jgi:hypothetical protein